MAENITTANIKYARDLGFDYGFATDEAQAQLFTGFFQGLSMACAPSALDTQLCYLVDKLDAKTLAHLENLGDYAKLTRENRT